MSRGREQQIFNGKHIYIFQQRSYGNSVQNNQVIINKFEKESKNDQKIKVLEEKISNLEKQMRQMQIDSQSQKQKSDVKTQQKQIKPQTKQLQHLHSDKNDVSLKRGYSEMTKQPQFVDLDFESDELGCKKVLVNKINANEVNPMARRLRTVIGDGFAVSELRNNGVILSHPKKSTFKKIEHEIFLYGLPSQLQLTFNYKASALSTERIKDLQRKSKDSGCSIFVPYKSSVKGLYCQACNVKYENQDAIGVCEDDSDDEPIDDDAIMKIDSLNSVSKPKVEEEVKERSCFQDHSIQGYEVSQVDPLGEESAICVSSELNEAKDYSHINPVSETSMIPAITSQCEFGSAIPFDQNSDFPSERDQLLINVIDNNICDDDSHHPQ